MVGAIVSGSAPMVGAIVVDACLPPDSFHQGCGVGARRNFKCSRSRKEFLGGVGVDKNVPTPTPTSV
jgi:hypothetical protein